MILYHPNNIVMGYKRKVNINVYKSTFLIEQKVKAQQNLTKLSLKHKIEIKNEKYLIWKSPSLITNAIITISKKNKVESIFSSLNLMLKNFICKHIVISIVDFYTVNELKPIFLSLSKRNIHSVLILLNYDEEYFTDEFGDLVNELKLNIKILIIKSPFNKNYDDIIHFRIEKEFSKINSKNVNSFNSNIQLLTESQKHNTYFNRKLYISSSGKIKNAPETDQVFGYIQDIKSEKELKEIISTPDFQKYWFVHKDLIDVCKDCEFRHICVDNRIPIERSKDEWYYSLECNYNPYISKWENEEGYQTLEECGVISNEKGFSINHEKILKINDVLLDED